MAQEDDFISKCVEGVLLGFFQPGRGSAPVPPGRWCRRASTATSSSAYSPAPKHQAGQPADTDTMVGAQVSMEQFERIMGYMDVARRDGAHFLLGGGKATVGSDIAGGYYIQPTLLQAPTICVCSRKRFSGPPRVSPPSK